MAKKVRKKITTVREHPRHVAVSSQNPEGITIVDQHQRRLKGTYLDPEEIDRIEKEHTLSGIVFPNDHDLGRKNGSRYDKIIAIWTNYFSKKFNLLPPLDPDLVKALIGSESDFDSDPKQNKKALGIAQITKKTLFTLQDPKGEANDLIFAKIRQKDLKNPSVAIPMAVRWLARKSQIAASKLGHTPTGEEIILEYKGLLRSKSPYKNNALRKFREFYEILKDNK